MIDKIISWVEDTFFFVVEEHFRSEPGEEWQTWNVWYIFGLRIPLNRIYKKY